MRPRGTYRSRRTAPSTSLRLPCSWFDATGALGRNDFVTLSTGGGTQLRRLDNDRIAVMFNYRNSCVFFRPENNVTKVAMCGAALVPPTEGVLSYMNSVLIVLDGRPTTLPISIRIVRDGTFSAILLRSPSDDLGLPSGDPFRLDAKHDCIITVGSREILGTSWRPDYCSGLDACSCRWCRGIQEQRMKAIAKAIAGEDETAF